jgi:ribosomal protein S12 methylthiotransferase accessory factor YcaO
LCSPGRPFVRPTGVGVGYDWDEAVTAGLVGQCRQLTVRQLAAAGTPFPRVDVDGAALDARGERYRALLAATGQPVRIYDVTGPLGVPTMIGYLGSEAAGCASSLSGVDAVVDTLEELLLYHQARSTGQHVYAPPPAPSIRSHLRGSGEAPAARRPAPDPTAATVIAALVAHGHRPVAVPLDHDREVNAVMPYTVHVVLSND